MEWQPRWLVIIEVVFGYLLAFLTILRIVLQRREPTATLAPAEPTATLAPPEPTATPTPPEPTATPALAEPTATAKPAARAPSLKSYFVVYTGYKGPDLQDYNLWGMNGDGSGAFEILDRSSEPSGSG